MTLQQILMPLLGVVLVASAWHLYGWGGVAIAVGGIVMWLLLHFTRVTHVLRRASQRPMGYVASAVMLNAKLKPGVNLLHVLAMTGALGEQLSAESEQPEIYRWTDGGASSVTCEFAKGRLVKWTLARPPAPTDGA
ncbi:MAG: glycerate kinase [Ramlibacter sp.]|nr:glycerate kinase [Ramlibacter sp.]